MYPVAGPALTVPVTLVTSFFMLGIEAVAVFMVDIWPRYRFAARVLDMFQDIGSRVEQPFNVLPL